MQTDLNLTHLKDAELLKSTKQLAVSERQILTKILHHLREVGRRKLFSDLGYSSLFEYAVKELGYSDEEAGRRIQALRLLNEIPQLENKIESGSLSLTNISQAQSFFREAAKSEHTITPVKLTTEDKIHVLAELEGKSTREAQKILLEKADESQINVSKERVKVISATHTQVNLILDNDLLKKLETIRSLLGPKGATMNTVELIDAMACIAESALMSKKFGKKRAKQSENVKTPAEVVDNSGAGSVNPISKSKNQRYLPQAMKHAVWQRDQGKCCKCGSQRNLHFDHIKPVAFGGEAQMQNIRLLCFSCNQRQAIKCFLHPSVKSRRGKDDLQVRS